VTKTVEPAEYQDAFGIGSPPDATKSKAALDAALDVRKFEIQLYWTRATYFWTFIAAALAGYGAIQALDNPQAKTDLSVLISCVGFVLSFCWYCANQGSKQWQENWENHVDLLEDEVTGPLYKTVLRRAPKSGRPERVKDFVTGPRPFSVSKINQVISLYFCGIWGMLLIYSLPRVSLDAPISLLYVGAIGLSAGTVIFVWYSARTHPGDHRLIANRRDALLLPQETGGDDSSYHSPVRRSSSAMAAKGARFVLRWVAAFLVLAGLIEGMELTNVVSEVSVRNFGRRVWIIAGIAALIFVFVRQQLEWKRRRDSALSGGDRKLLTDAAQSKFPSQFFAALGSQDLDKFCLKLVNLTSAGLIEITKGGSEIGLTEAGREVARYLQRQRST
jgi:hypothetical protein